MGGIRKDVCWLLVNTDHHSAGSSVVHQVTFLTKDGSTLKAPLLRNLNETSFSAQAIVKAILWNSLNPMLHLSPSAAEHVQSVALYGIYRQKVEGRHRHSSAGDSWAACLLNVTWSVGSLSDGSSAAVIGWDAALWEVHSPDWAVSLYAGITVALAYLRTWMTHGSSP